MTTDDHNQGGPSTVFYDHGAEATLLGMMLLDGRVIADAEALVDKRSFHNPAHSLLFEVMAQMRADGRPTEPVAVMAHLAERGLIRQVPNNGVYVHTLVEQASNGGDWRHYAAVVADRALLRDLDVGLSAARSAIRAGGTGSTADLVERVRVMVSDLSQRALGDGDDWARWIDMIRPGFDGFENAEQTDETPGVSTGLIDLDGVIHGLQNGRLYVVAGPPGSGKSTLGACNFVRAAAFAQKIPTALMSMEMPKTEVFNRIACAEAGVSSDAAVKGNLTEEDWTKLARMAGDTGEAPLWVTDRKKMTFADIRVRARRLQQEHGIQLLVVDYLALIECRDSRPRNQQIDELCREFHNLAGEMNLPVVLLAQTNRNAAQRGDKRPQLSDLKESGGIEAHSDAVIFVHRPSMFEKGKRLGEVDLVIAKNRNGECDVDIPVAAQLHFNRFVSMAHHR